MKQKDGVSICEMCENHFSVGQDIVFSYRASGIWGGSPFAEVGGPNEYMHKECYDGTLKPSTSGLDAVKEALVNLGSDAQQKIYVFLHDACGRRMG